MYTSYKIDYIYKICKITLIFNSRRFENLFHTESTGGENPAPPT